MTIFQSLKVVLKISWINCLHQALNIAIVNTTLLHTYWQIGKIIVKDEALHIGDIEYEKQSLRQLSKVLITGFGKGFSRSNLSNMRQFYLTHKDVQTASG